MPLNLTPNYEDIISEPKADIVSLLSKIPTNALLITVAALNARCDAKISDEDNLRFYFRRIPEKLLQIRKGIHSLISKNNVPVSIFSKHHLCRLAIASLKDPNNEIRDTTPSEDWSIFKAYIILLDQFKQEQNVILKQMHNSSFGVFNSLTWPIIAEQYQFMYDRVELFDLIRSATLVDELIEMNFENELKNYSLIIGMPLLDMIANIYGLSEHNKILEVDGWKTPSFFVNVDYNIIDIFNSLFLDIYNVSKDSNYNENFLALKKYPLLKYKNSLILINKKFLTNKIYNGLLFDFYSKSGMQAHYSKFDTFKSIIGKNVAERRTLKPLIEAIFPKKHYIKIFSEKDSHPDCYLRIHNRIFLFEFKDYMMSSKVSTSLDAKVFKDEIDRKFVRNKQKDEKGVSQLAKQINSMSEIEYDFDMIYSKGIKMKKLEIYPIIVYSDYQYSIPGINNYLTTVFNSMISVGDKFKKVYDPIMININFLFQNSNFISANGLDQLIKSYFKMKEIKVKTLERSPTPDKWIEANLSFDDIGVHIDYKKRSESNILEAFLEKVNLKNLFSTCH